MGAAAERRPGRPRSERLDEAIVAAVVELLEVQGYPRLSIEAVAARAGVGKATIYRRWSGKDELVVDVLAGMYDDAPTPALRGDSVRDDLVTVLEAARRRHLDTRVGRLLPRLVSEGSPALLTLYYDRVIRPRRQFLVDVLSAAVQRGELRPGLDPELAVDLLFGTLFYRVLLMGPRPQPTHRDVEAIVDAALAGLARPATP